MSEISEGAYRAARLEIASQIPDLAPQLADNPTIVQDALIDHIQDNGHEIAMRGDQYIHTRDEAGIKKLEQHAYVTFLAMKQTAVLIDGAGTNAAYKPEFVPFGERNPGAFEAAVKSVLVSGREVVKDHYSDLDDPHRQWWRTVSQRYGDLGVARRAGLHNASAYIKLEAEDLDEALAAPTLGHEIAQLTDYVYDNARTSTAEQRLAVAHQLVYLATFKAGLGVPAFSQSVKLSDLNAPMVYDEKHGKNFAQLVDSNWDTAHLREVAKTYNEVPVMKCPYHTAPDGLAETSLTTQAHASVNLATEYGLFEDNSLAVLGDFTHFQLPSEYSF